ncbi:atpase e1 [Anaeramoeba flamelloides]|uniref:Atpase e1 n=1 Tax=Anaeramoeba flamelloides TaxID=1746091 RepID=A0ABQ8XVI1_9EUKA|nr:atpase e1 [Anaeramoeba flamelloides]
MTHRNTLFVQGLTPQAHKKLLYYAFIPFGEISRVVLPKDQIKNHHKGFGYVQFESVEDAEAAMDNMDQSEILGQTITVTVAKEGSFLINNHRHRAIWNTQEYTDFTQKKNEQNKLNNENTQEGEKDEEEEDEETDEKKGENIQIEEWNQKKNNEKDNEN